MSRVLSILSVCLFACGGPSMSMSGDDDVVPIDAPTTVTLDPAKCVGFAQSMVAAAQTCGTSLPGNAQATFESFCRKGVTAAAMCGGNAAGGLDCFASPDANDWVCQLNEPYPYCNGDIAAALGAYCVIALGNPQCASGVKCTYDADCSTGLGCNDATGQCFSTTAYCVGLPCNYNADCPQGHTCNSTEHACVGD